MHAPHNGVFSLRRILEHQDEPNLYIRGSFVQFEGEQIFCFHLDENFIQALRVSAISFGLHILKVATNISRQLHVEVKNSRILFNMWRSTSGNQISYSSII